MTRQGTFLILFALCALTIFSQNTKIKLNSVDITLPGKWKLTGKNEMSGQYTFENIQSETSISVSVRPKTRFNFFNDSLTDFELVDNFYRWDANYWKQDTKYQVTEIKRDEKKKLIIWFLTMPKGSNYVLNGIKDSHLVGIQVQGDKTNEADRVKLIESIYLN